MSPKSPYLRTVNINRPQATAGPASGTPSSPVATAAPPLPSPAATLGLAPLPSDRPTVLADQAVFTSIRSHLGEGYRIIAASPGIRPDERAEITRRCPSHGSLCSDAADAVGMSFYTLTSRRHCVALHCHAGVEHTARGGHRVYTHLVVLDDAVFERFGCDATRVFESIARAVGDNLVMRVPPRLDGLRLTVPSAADVGTGPAAARRPAETRFYSACCQGDGLWTICDPNDPLGGFHAALAATPAAARRRTSVTIGVKFSPSRPMRVVVVGRDNGETNRALHGQEHAFVDLHAAPAGSCDDDAWFDFVARRAQGGRLREVVELTDAMTQPHGPALLNRIAEMCDALDRIEQMDAATLDLVRARFGAATTTSTVEAGLVTRIGEAVLRRASALADAEKAKG